MEREFLTGKEAEDGVIGDKSGGCGGPRLEGTLSKLIIVCNGFEMDKLLLSGMAAVAVAANRRKDARRCAGGKRRI